MFFRLAMTTLKKIVDHQFIKCEFTSVPVTISATNILNVDKLFSKATIYNGGFDLAVRLGFSEFFGKFFTSSRSSQRDRQE